MTGVERRCEGVSSWIACGWSLQFVDADVVGAEDAAISLEKVRRKGRKTGRKNGQEGIRGLRYYIYRAKNEKE